MVKRNVCTNTNTCGQRCLFTPSLHTEKATHKHTVITHAHTSTSYRHAAPSPKQSRFSSHLWNKTKKLIKRWERAEGEVPGGRAGFFPLWRKMWRWKPTEMSAFSVWLHRIFHLKNRSLLGRRGCCWVQQVWFGINVPKESCQSHSGLRLSAPTLVKTALTMSRLQTRLRSKCGASCVRISDIFFSNSDLGPKWLKCWEAPISFPSTLGFLTI